MLTDDYQYESEEEKQQASKKPDKKGEQPDELRFDVIKRKVQNAKKKIIYPLNQKGVKLLILTN